MISGEDRVHLERKKLSKKIQNFVIGVGSILDPAPIEYPLPVSSITDDPMRNLKRDLAKIGDDFRAVFEEQAAGLRKLHVEAPAHLEAIRSLRSGALSRQRVR